MSKTSPNNQQVKKNGQALGCTFNILSLFFIPKLFSLLLFSLSHQSCITAFSLVMPPSQSTCVCVCSHALSRIMSMLMFIVVVYIHLTTASIFPPCIALSLTSPGTPDPPNSLLLSGIPKHTFTHTSSCAPVCFLESPYGCFLQNPCCFFHCVFCV